MVKAALAGAIYFHWAKHEDKVRELDIPEFAASLNDGSHLYELYGKKSGKEIKKLQPKTGIEIRIPCLSVNSKGTGIVSVKSPDLIYLADKRIFVDRAKLENNAFRMWTMPGLIEEAEKNLEGII